MLVTRSLGAALAGVLLLAASPAPQASPANADAAFTALANDYYMASLKRNPIQATFAGLHTYDAEMGDFSAAAERNELAIDRATLAQIAAIDASQFSPEVAIDAKII